MTNTATHTQEYYSIRIGTGRVLHAMLSETMSFCGKTADKVTANINSAPTCKSCARMQY